MNSNICGTHSKDYFHHKNSLFFRTSIFWSNSGFNSWSSNSRGIHIKIRKFRAKEIRRMNDGCSYFESHFDRTLNSALTDNISQTSVTRGAKAVPVVFVCIEK